MGDDKTIVTSPDSSDHLTPISHVQQHTARAGSDNPPLMRVKTQPPVSRWSLSKVAQPSYRRKRHKMSIYCTHSTYALKCNIVCRPI